jgi:AcrR family transcriptional regulator
MQAPAPKIRLIEGLAAAINEKGYASTTIADIVRHARVSKRTFYENFPDKESCFLATYEIASARAIQTIVEAAQEELPWEEQIRAATEAHLRVLESEPVLTRTFLLEIQAAGSRALEMRREVHHRFAEVLAGFVARARKKHPELRALSPRMAIAIVGGINELLLMAVEKDGARHLVELGETAAELIRAVLVAPPPGKRTKRR